MSNSFLGTSVPRSTLAGRSDKYAPPDSTNRAQGTIDGALRGRTPFFPVGGLLTNSDYDRAVERLSRYSGYWEAFRGRHFRNVQINGESKTVFNFCRRIVNTGVEFCVADGIKTRTLPGNEALGEWVDSIWRKNDMSGLMTQAVGLGAITGDSYYYVTLATKDETGADLDQKDQRIVLNTINPAFVHPVYTQEGTRRLKSCLIQFPINDGDAERIFSMNITPTEWEVWLDYTSQGKAPNPFGCVNVVHVPNLPDPDCLFGLSDLEDVIPLNKAYNTTWDSISRVLAYHGEPTTIITGATAGSLQKSAKCVWSGLPADAKVFNLEMQGDLSAMYTALERLKDDMCIVGEVPALVLDGSAQAISNTSGLALQLMFGPLVAKTNRRQARMSYPLAQVNQLIVRAGELIGTDMAQFADYKGDPLTPSFTSALPKDTAALVDMAVKLTQGGLWSKANAIREIGCEDFARLALELVSDSQCDLAMAKERQVATGGGNPNLVAPFLSSVCLTEDLQEAAQSVEQPVKEGQDPMTFD